MPHYTYPPHTPLFQTWIALNLDAWDHQMIKLFYPFYFLCYITVQYSFLKNFTSARWALFSIVLLVSCNFLIYHSTIAYRDVTTLYYNCACIILLLTWHRTKDKNILFLISLMAGLMTSNKLEGIGYFLIYAIILCIILAKEKNCLIKEKFFNFIRFIISCLCIFLFYQIYLAIAIAPKATLEAKENLSLTLREIQFHFSAALLERILVVGIHFFENLFYSNNWNILWIILLMSPLNIRGNRYPAEIKLLMLSLALFFGMYYFGFAFTQHYYWITKTQTVLSRGILHFLPLASILIVLLNFSKKDPENSVTQK